MGVSLLPQITNKSFDLSKLLIKRMKDGDGLLNRPSSLRSDREEEALKRNKGDKPKAFCGAASNCHRNHVIY